MDLHNNDSGSSGRRSAADTSSRLVLPQPPYMDSAQACHFAGRMVCLRLRGLVLHKQPLDLPDWLPGREGVLHYELESFGLSFMAGVVATRRANQWCPDFQEHLGTYDLRMAEAILNQASPETITSYLQYLSARAEDMFNQPGVWDAFESAASFTLRRMTTRRAGVTHQVLMDYLAPLLPDAPEARPISRAAMNLLTSARLYRRR